jgi:hypothetical protein
MRYSARSFLCITLLFAGVLSAQERIAPGGGVYAAPATARYHRMICLVHLTGSGQKGDERKPEYVPPEVSQDRSGIISWSMQISDDGKMAIVHYVAVDPKAFDAIRADKRGEVRVFEIGKHKKEDIEKELKKFKKDFTLDSLQVVAQ